MWFAIGILFAMVIFAWTGMFENEKNTYSVDVNLKKLEKRVADLEMKNRFEK